MKLYGDTVSISVDCDALAHYLNFAPPGTKVESDPYTYNVMCRDILKLFARYGIKATFFCIADQLDQPETLTVFKEIVAAGHEIGNHTLSHPEIDSLSDEEHVCDIRGGHEKISNMLGIRPIGYRAPAYYITERGLHELAELGYLYDSSVCNSRLTRLIMTALSFVEKRFKLKKNSPLHARFSGSEPCVIVFNDGRELIEWPIPTACGVAYYGTLHCSMPAPVFFMQTFLLDFYKRHIHYEIHPVEVITRECYKEFPWTDTLPFARRNDLLSWLDMRLKRLTAARSVITLEELSASYLHAMQH